MCEAGRDLDGFIDLVDAFNCQSIAADKKMRRTMQKQTDRKNALNTYRGIVEKEGVEVARQKFLPNIVSKQQRRNEKVCRKKTAKKKTSKPS